METTKDRVSLFIDFCRNSIYAHDVDPAIDYMNYIIRRMELNEEQVIWLCFLYGITYQLPTAWVIWNEMPDLELVNKERLVKWLTPEVLHRLPFQQDKIKCRPKMAETILSYQSIVGKSQAEYFDKLLDSDDPHENFWRMWSPLKSIYCFGRFSTWNFCQALKHVAGYNVEPTILMIGEPDSVSFTDGLAYAFNQDDKLTKKEIIGKKKVKVYYQWSDKEKEDMERSALILKKSLNLDNFQLETLACAFKKIWRTADSRYVGYYNDRAADDIKKTASMGWNGIDWKLLWDARQATIPQEYIHNNKGVNTMNFKLEPYQKVYT